MANGLEHRSSGLAGRGRGSLGETRKPACIVVDLDLPEGEGTELLEELDGVPVLALIKDRSPKRQAEAMGLGADKVLSTTGPVEEIAAAVERLISR
jgi:DNA-binding NarL/FixJ family response regulator